MIYPITPYPKPRMTRRDKWLSPPRASVAKYRAFCTLCRVMHVKLPASGSWVVFRLPMAQSWSKKRKDNMRGKPHTQKPDLDNLFKALGDAVYGDDSIIWDFRCTKYWDDEGSIEIKEG